MVELPPQIYPEDQESGLPPEVEVVIPQSEIDESTPAFLGLRRFIVATRLAMARETLTRREDSHHVITSAPGGARFVRGFGSAPEAPEERPVTPLQRTTSLHRQGQNRKIRKAEHERWRINEVYGRKPEEPELKREDFPSTNEFRWEAMQRKLARSDRGASHDLGNEEEHREDLFGPIGERRRMPIKHRQAEVSAAAADKKAARTIESRTKRLDRGASGDTMPGRLRSRLIERSARRVQRLSDRMAELNRLAGVQDEEPIPVDFSQITPPPLHSRDPITPDFPNQDRDPNDPWGAHHSTDVRTTPPTPPSRRPIEVHRTMPAAAEVSQSADELNGIDEKYLILFEDPARIDRMEARIAAKTAEIILREQEKRDAEDFLNGLEQGRGNRLSPKDSAQIANIVRSQEIAKYFYNYLGKPKLPDNVEALFIKKLADARMRRQEAEKDEEATSNVENTVSSPTDKPGLRIVRDTTTEAPIASQPEIIDPIYLPILEQGKIDTLEAKIAGRITEEIHNEQARQGVAKITTSEISGIGRNISSQELAEYLYNNLGQEEIPDEIMQLIIEKTADARARRKAAEVAKK